MTTATAAPSIATLIVRARDLACAVPLAYVVEVMRPLPVEALDGAPPYVLGLSIIRGRPTPVVHLAALLGRGGGAPARFVAMRLGDRRLALAVDAAPAIRTIPPDDLDDLPPLLGGDRGAVVESLGVLDARLLVALRAARVVPDDIWPRLAAEGARS